MSVKVPVQFDLASRCAVVGWDSRGWFCNQQMSLVPSQILIPETFLPFSQRLSEYFSRVNMKQMLSTGARCLKCYGTWEFGSPVNTVPSANSKGTFYWLKKLLTLHFGPNQWKWGNHLRFENCLIQEEWMQGHALRVGDEQGWSFDHLSCHVEWSCTLIFENLIKIPDE